jgi:hypothetical protein
MIRGETPSQLFYFAFVARRTDEWEFAIYPSSILQLPSSIGRNFVPQDVLRML